MRLVIRTENCQAHPGEDPVWIVMDFTPQLLQEIYDVQKLLHPRTFGQLLLCGLGCQSIVFRAEILAVVTDFNADYAHFGDMEHVDFMHDYDPVPEYITPEQLGTLAAKFEEPRIYIEYEDIMWSVTVNDTRYSCCYSSINIFANLLAQRAFA